MNNHSGPSPVTLSPATNVQRLENDGCPKNARHKNVSYTQTYIYMYMYTYIYMYMYAYICICIHTYSLGSMIPYFCHKPCFNVPYRTESTISLFLY